jgi:hypothetical protein
MFFITENTIKAFELQLKLGTMLLVLHLVGQVLMVVLVYENDGDFQLWGN